MNKSKVGNTLLSVVRSKFPAILDETVKDKDKDQVSSNNTKMEHSSNNTRQIPQIPMIEKTDLPAPKLFSGLALKPRKVVMKNDLPKKTITESSEKIILDENLEVKPQVGKSNLDFKKFYN